MSSISFSTFRQELPISPVICLPDAYSCSTTSSQNLGAPSAKVEFYTYVDAFLYVSGATLTTIFPLALPVFSFCIACGAGSKRESLANHCFAFDDFHPGSWLVCNQRDWALRQ